jgi:hypothetical protein
MITAKYTLSTTPARNEIKGQYEQEVDTISELEDFIAYNRAYFVKLQFSGSFKNEVEE